MKDNYFRLSKKNNPHSWQDTNDRDKILAIVCFVVALDKRGKGIAKALLQYACTYAAENGFNYAESYPTVGAFDASNCCGSDAMYRKLGFTIIDVPDGVVARKKVL